MPHSSDEVFFTTLMRALSPGHVALAEQNIADAKAAVVRLVREFPCDQGKYGGTTQAIAAVGGDLFSKLDNFQLGLVAAVAVSMLAEHQAGVVAALLEG